MLDINKEKLLHLKKYLLDNYPKEKIFTFNIDVTDENQIANCCKQLSEKELRVDILINNAAVDSKLLHEVPNYNRFEDYDLNKWNLELNIGLTSAFLCSKIFGTIMAKNLGGVIINIASDLSIIAPDQRIYQKESQEIGNQFFKSVSYSVVKSGLIGLTKYLATYWNTKNVRVNALSPGGIFDNHDPEFVKNISNLIPLGRMARADEYQSAIQFLSSDASSYMTGHNLVIDGGRSVW